MFLSTENIMLTITIPGKFCTLFRTQNREFKVQLVYFRYVKAIYSGLRLWLNKQNFGIALNGGSKHTT